MTQPLERPKVTGIGIAVAVPLVLLEMLALLEICVAYGGIWSVDNLVSGIGTLSDCLLVVTLLLAIAVLVGVAMIFARRQRVGRILLWGAPVQLLCSFVLVIQFHSWWDSVAYGVMTVLAVVLWLPAVSAKTPPPVGYGMPYGAPGPGMPQYPGQVPMGQQYPVQQYPGQQYPQQYGTPQPYPQPMPGQPPQGQWPPQNQPPQGQWPPQGQPPQGWPPQ